MHIKTDNIVDEKPKRKFQKKWVMLIDLFMAEHWQICLFV